MSFPSPKDIADVRKKYPQLHYEPTNCNWRLVGSIDIVDEVGNYYDNYDVEIVGTPQFPYQFPKLFERSNKFPKTADWHTFKDESCCTAVRGKEILATQTGISLRRYIDEFVVPYLANQTYCRKNGHYVNGEYAHNLMGELAFFQELLDIKSISIISETIKLALSDSFNDPNNVPCFCGSGKKFKHCHKRAIQKMRSLGKDYLLGVYRRIYSLALT